MRNGNCSTRTHKLTRMFIQYSDVREYRRDDHLTNISIQHTQNKVHRTTN